MRFLAERARALGASGALAAAVVLLIVIAVAAPGILAPGDALAVSPADGFLAPSAAHPFGTDESGRDVLTRVLHGAAASAGIGLAATGIGIGGGLVIGFAGGLGPRLVDAALTRIVEVLYALPTLVMALLFVAVMGPGPRSSILAIGLATAPGYARMIRARVRQIARGDYVAYARHEGASAWRVFARHILPNTLWPLVAMITLGIGQAIVWVSALSFLGLGAEPPSPEWGSMLNAGRVYIGTAWWMTLFPGLAIVVTATALTVLGRRLSADGARRPRRGPRRTAPVAPPRPSAADDALLAIGGLTVDLPGSGRVLDGVSLDIRPGEVLAVVGESGAGKSVLARTLLGLTQADPRARVAAAELSFDGRDLARADQRTWRRLRGSEIGLVLQDALQSLDPLRTVAAEVGEPLAVRRVPRSERRERIIGALERAGLDDAAILRRRSGELSGGMRQRVLIASAIVGGARVIIADEPTTALDATVAARVLDLLRALARDGAGILLIAHDLHAARQVADRIAVLERGRVIEEGAAERILSAPSHATTRDLLDAVPSGPKPPAAPASGTSGSDAASSATVLAADGVTRRYGDVTAVDDVSLEMSAGEVVGIVGESGSGKSTLARLLIGAERPDRGSVTRHGEPRVRLVPQDPLGSFDPRHTVGRILRLSHRDGAPSPAELLERVGLDARLLDRRPAQLSGGQRQRVAIARALAADPDVLVCDEPVSALDVTTQKGILDLLLGLQERDGLAMVFISHDLAVVRRVADRVIVMRDGRVVESGPTERVYADPSHAFTRELIAASR
ncbi:ABC transporter ATP-binding protein/permease [Microbacterium karelineae]|uniref:ABC transporter ATP-binding protein/permease n=1 Tax=Microbacterium karelineae TaxID=2654283 RepID=UPI0012EB04EE|nr:ATP-binding cassette domain-containing protein [Microbacterium karelineae]